MSASNIILILQMKNMYDQRVMLKEKETLKETLKEKLKETKTIKEKEIILKKHLNKNKETLKETLKGTLK